MDIRKYKTNLRNEIKTFRNNMPQNIKKEYDDAIAENLLNSVTYKNADAILCYMSTSIEVNTEKIILSALKDGKEVALPRCIPDTRLMDFVIIKSLDDLEKGSFGVLEPKKSITDIIIPNAKSLCIIPALMYDVYGYRLGYGGGYYDRFLCNFSGTTLGIIYEENITNILQHGKYDVPVNQIVCEHYITKTQKIC